MMRAIARALAAAVILAAGSLHHASAQDAGFDIVRFQIDGNTLLPAERVQALVAPFVGRGKVYGDVQKALEALEGDYRRLGYGTVQVYVPEQELTSGVVRLLVTESAIGKVSLTGNKFFGDANVRASLRQLREGEPPNMRQLSENIQLANENPSKKVEVTLGAAEEEGKVNAKVAVTDEDPQKYIVTFDNTGSAATGNHRIGIAYRHANIGDRDQVLTLAATTSPDAPESAKVEIFSLAYKIPLYAFGDSIDLIYGKSSSDTPSTQATGFNLAGKGEVFAVRWNHYFPRRGEYSSRLVGGFDYKYINARRTTNGVPGNIDPPLGDGAFTPHTLRPLSLAYIGQRESPGRNLDYSVSVAKNISLGSSYAYTTLQGISGVDRYTLLGGRAVPNNFEVYRGRIGLAQALPDDWALRLAFSTQYAPTALPAAEQFSLTGTGAVRGFGEATVRMDSGYVANIEVYGPDVANRLGVPGNFKLLAFYDFARGRNKDTAVNRAPWVTPFEKVGIASLGAGIRYAYSKDVAFKFDLARVMDAGPVNVDPRSSDWLASGVAGNPANTEGRGDWRGHFGLQLGF